jgi:hypothetical protein
MQLGRGSPDFRGTGIEGGEMSHSAIRSMHFVFLLTILQQQTVRRFPLRGILSQHILSAIALLHASRHTSMDRGPAHRGKYRMLLFHICETVIDMLCAGRSVTVS